ncbi:MAG: hypothetical protein WCA78_09080 [Rhizomicrobium sp.]
MDAISASSRLTEKNDIVVHDVGACIRSWGMRGILSGGIFGFILGAVFVAIPLTTDVLTFGTLGTLIVGAVECAVIAGGFGALAAALTGKGILRSDATNLGQTFAASRAPARADWQEGDIPLSTWPARWAFPGATAIQQISPVTGDCGDTVDPSLQHAQMRSNAIDAWENGSCGP